MEISGSEFSVSEVLCWYFTKCSHFLTDLYHCFGNQHKHSVQLLGFCLGVIRVNFLPRQLYRAKTLKKNYLEKNNCYAKDLLLIFKSRFRGFFVIRLYLSQAI